MDWLKTDNIGDCGGHEIGHHAEKARGLTKRDSVRPIKKI